MSHYEVLSRAIIEDRISNENPTIVNTIVSRVHELVESKFVSARFGKRYPIENEACILEVKQTIKKYFKVYSFETIEQQEQPSIYDLLFNLFVEVIKHQNANIGRGF